MAYRANSTVGSIQFIYFKSPPSLTLSNFVVTFLINGASTSTPSLTLTEIGGGLYLCQYTPIIVGNYYLELHDSTSGIDVVDQVQIDLADTSNTVALTQDYGFSGRFQVATSNPSQTRILIYNSTDWIAGNTSGSYLVNSTGVDSSGNWLVTPIQVVHGTYHIVQSIAYTSEKVLAAFMVV